MCNPNLQRITTRQESDGWYIEIIDEVTGDTFENSLPFDTERQGIESAQRFIMASMVDEITTDEEQDHE